MNLSVLVNYILFLSENNVNGHHESREVKLSKSKKVRIIFQFGNITDQFGTISDEESLKSHEDSSFLVS